MSHLVTGDFHNGDPDQDTHGLRSFLQWAAKEDVWSKYPVRPINDVIANGDVWHYSRMPICAIDGMPLPDIAIAGNHDWECRDCMLLNYEGDEWTSLDGKTYAEHGHHEPLWQGLDSNRWRRWFVDRVLKYGYCREGKVGDPDVFMRVARGLEQKLAPQAFTIGWLRQALYGHDLAASRGFEVVVLAHTHVPYVSISQTGTIVVNVGAWTPSHVKIDPVPIRIYGDVVESSEVVHVGEIPSFFWNVEERSLWRWRENTAREVWKA